MISRLLTPIIDIASVEQSITLSNPTSKIIFNTIHPKVLNPKVSIAVATVAVGLENTNGTAFENTDGSTLENTGV